ncbi:MAG: hypothetical protein B6U76_07255 [Desulfurococcales archaeon ex4484_217_2]|nr:MAG: hypothetical protein B6U76_07255 [Desulfurococcales archaeon ex4484_217_2]
MLPLELILKSIFLCFLGLKVLLQMVALTLLIEWTRLTNSRFHKGLLLFLLLITSSGIYRSYIDSAIKVIVNSQYLIAQTIETIGWAIFVYVLYKSE